MNLEKLEHKVNETGAFLEAFHFPNDGQLSVLSILPNEVRGNHYHQRKTEHFLIVGGTAEIASKDRETGDVMKVKLSPVKPIVVTIPPNNTHAITAGPQGSTMLIWCDEIYNEKDSDTYPEEI